jgi:hypothetical protein
VIDVGSALRRRVGSVGCALLLVWSSAASAQSLEVDAFQLESGHDVSVYCRADRVRGAVRLYLAARSSRDSVPAAIEHAYEAAREGARGVSVVVPRDVSPRIVPSFEPATPSNGACGDVWNDVRAQWAAQAVALERSESPEHEADRTATGFNLSLVLGGAVLQTTRAELGFAIAGRPELYFAREEWSPGVGAFLEVGFTGGLHYEAGVATTFPVAEALHLGASFGLGGWRSSGDDQLAAAGGLFFGYRWHNTISGFDASAGVRADGRWGFRDRSWAVEVRLQLDLTLAVAFLSFL